MTVGGDSHIALEDVAEFCFNIDGPGKLVVAEDGFNARPDRTGTVVWLHGTTKDLRGDGSVQPRYDAEIILHLSSVVRFRIRAINMMCEIKLAEHHIKETVPLGVV